MLKARNWTALWLMAAAAVAAETAEETAEEKGRRIMAEYERRDEGWVDSRADMQMIIRRGDGREVTREVRVQTLEGENGHDRSLLVFDEPLDVRGTVFLTHSHPLEPDDQWIFLPSLNRVKRISTRGKTGRFMGSEFTFEDMEAFAVQKNEYRYLREEACGELVCHVIESRPRDEYSGYEKTVFYLDRQELRAQRIDFYSKRTGRHSKTLTMTDYELYKDRFWRAGRAVMKNRVSGAETEIHWRNQRFDTGLNERQFRKAALERRQ